MWTRGLGLSACEETQKFSATSAITRITAIQRMFGPDDGLEGRATATVRRRRHPPARGLLAA